MNSHTEPGNPSNMDESPPMPAAELPHPPEDTMHDASKSTAWPPHHHLPLDVAAAVCQHLDPLDRFRLSTLLSLPHLQAASFRALRGPHEFDAAARTGSPQLCARLLRFCRAAALPARYTDAALFLACFHAHVPVLRWWRDSGLPAAYSDAAVDCASSRRHLDVLDWWKDESGWEVKYSAFAMDFACENGHEEVVRWWKESGLPVKASGFPAHAKLLE